MNCKYCNADIPENVKFCPECGKASPMPDPEPEPQVQFIPPIMTIEEVAKFLKVSKPTVYNLIRKGMPWFPVGGHRRFITDEIVEWAKQIQKRRKGA
jgi:excisionase family DNA binding protein